jgi:hypothetical protein
MPRSSPSPLRPREGANFDTQALAGVMTASHLELHLLLTVAESLAAAADLALIASVSGGSQQSAGFVESNSLGPRAYISSLARVRGVTRRRSRADKSERDKAVPNIPDRCLSQQAERVLELSRASGQDVRACQALARNERVGTGIRLHPAGGVRR